MQIDHKCAYGPCQCNVAETGQYCSDHCSQAEKLRDEGSHCTCGHQGCEALANAKSQPERQVELL